MKCVNLTYFFKAFLRYINGVRNKQMLMKSGFFDSLWYLEFYPDVAETGISAISHFLKYGNVERRNPSPLFDSDYYLKSNPDVALLGINPLVHFLRYGIKENRKSHGIKLIDNTENKEEIPIEYPIYFASKPRIACVVHAYYPDVFDELCKLICNIQIPFRLFISVPDIYVLEKVHKSVIRNRLANNVTYKISENRGRNFGPLFCEFSKHILNFDIILHVHTKKSLYTGSDFFQWRNYLYKSLIGSKCLVDNILSVFDKHTDVGLFYPAPFNKLPYWSCHWLSNKDMGLKLLDRLGIKYINNINYINYPVGGMFWARVDAIRPLLTAKLTYDDFADELGQTDGTLAHAIERDIGLISASQGYKFIESNYDAGCFNYNWSDHNIQQYHAYSLESYFQQIENIDIVSFDIFDTILCRPAICPDSVLKFIGHLLKRQYNEFDNFFNLRKEAEWHARKIKSFMGDVSITEIYSSFESISCLPRNLVDIAIQVELCIDVKLCRLRPSVYQMISTAKQLGKRVIAISDTYYNSDYINHLLLKNGVSIYFDKIYLSSEEQARKDRGDLWNKIISLEHFSANKWMHIGDNEQSDIQAASDRNLHFYHLMRPPELFRLVGYNDTTNTEKWGTHLVMGPTMLRIAGCPFTKGQSFNPIELDDAGDLGYTIFGPVVFTFMAWLISHPSFSKVSHLYFLSREGYLLIDLYNTMRVQFPNLKLPAATYFYTSRRVALSASLGVTSDIKNILAGFGFNGTLAKLLENRIGFVLPEEYKYLDYSISLPRDSLSVFDTLCSLSEHLILHGISELRNIQAYCHTTGIMNTDISAIVDIGYSATIQKSLQSIIGKGLIGFYFGTFSNAQEVSKLDGDAFGCYVENIPEYTTDNPFIKYSDLLESILTAPHGQVSGFHELNLEISPIFGTQHHDDNGLMIINNIQLGIKKYFNELVELYGEDLLFTDVDKQSALELLRLFYEGKITISQDILASLTVEDKFCGNNIKNINL